MSDPKIGPDVDEQRRVATQTHTAQCIELAIMLGAAGFPEERPIQEAVRALIVQRQQLRAALEHILKLCDAFEREPVQSISIRRRAAVVLIRDAAQEGLWQE